VPSPKGKGYVVNVASDKNGVGYGKWTHIDGWSESVIEQIRALEQTNQGNPKPGQARSRALFIHHLTPTPRDPATSFR